MNPRSSQFYDHFRSETAHFRFYGWRGPVVMRGSIALPVGLPSMRQAVLRLHDNDNRRSA